MHDVTKEASEAAPQPCVGPGSWQRWEFAFLGTLAAATMLTVWIVSRRAYLSHDELITAIIVSEPNLLKMLKGIAYGTETNPPLFFILQWFVARLFGTGDLAMRLLPAASVALAGPLVYATMRPALGPRISALALGLVFGLSRDVFLFIEWARYYGWLVFLGALAAWLFGRFHREINPGRSRYFLVFVTHCALVYTHVFGAFFSGTLLLAHVVLDWLDGRRRWALYSAVAGAWAAFLPWIPILRVQVACTRGGTFTPRLNVGTFFDELAMQTPWALALMFIALLALLAALRPATAPEPKSPTEPGQWTALAALALAWMSVPIVTWAASHVVRPFFMRRYVAPCLVAWAFLIGLVIFAAYRLPRRRISRAWPLLPRLHDLAWVGILVFCLGWQPLRAWKEPPKPATAFTDLDYGHPGLPIVFEDAMDFLPRFIYGRGRQYVLLLDAQAAEADPGYLTKLTERYYSRWRPGYPNIPVRYYEELPAWPDGFLAVDDPLCQTFDWLFKHKPELKEELLGPWPDGKQVYLVRRQATR